MNVRILIDMNLSPLWVEYFGEQGIDAIHWSNIGDHRALDRVIMQWAIDHERVVFTNDLDFGTLLALTHANTPSVIQMRTQNVMPEYWGKTLVALIKQYNLELANGALIVLDDTIGRVRILPLE